MMKTESVKTLPVKFDPIKISQNCLKIDANHYYDNDLLLRQEIRKKILHVLEADIKTI